ncbi:MAG: hypothetical protein COA86_03475 [Kangiella sp.]|nr:MAG: hypothetical protein COA86_03475 [Kangiella sp.]
MHSYTLVNFLVSVFWAKQLMTREKSDSHCINPKCSKDHHTDAETSDESPKVWFCEMGSTDDVFFVQW